MLQEIAAVLFTLAALGGATLATLHTTGKKVPVWAGLIHGLFAGPAIVLLYLAVSMEGNFRSRAGLALGIFILAAVGGVLLIRLHIKGRRLPPGLILAHGLTALTGYVLLLTSIFG